MALLGLKSQDIPPSPLRSPEERSEPPDKSRKRVEGETVPSTRGLTWGNRLAEELDGRKEAIVIVGAWAVFGLYHVVNAFSQQSEDQQHV